MTNDLDELKRLAEIGRLVENMTLYQTLQRITIGYVATNVVIGANPHAFGATAAEALILASGGSLAQTVTQLCDDLFRKEVG
jgi:hypothetical protein